MRIAFMGTPDFAVPTLEALIGAGHDIAAVYCQPPRPAGRGKAPRPSPVQLCAEQAAIDVRMPLSLRDIEAQREFAALRLNAAVVAAYGLILPTPILNAPKWRCINVHASLLPRWRGAAPIQRAILAGDETTGVTIMEMEAGLDTGPMLVKRETPIGRKTAGQLTDELAVMGAELTVEVLDRLLDMQAEPQPVEGVTHAPKLDKSEARLDFSRTAVEVERQVRAFNPTPGAFFECKGERIKILEAEVLPEGQDPSQGLTGPGPLPGNVMDDRLAIACAEGVLMPTLVQRAGRGAMAPLELLRGFPIAAGTRLE